MRRKIFAAIFIVVTLFSFISVVSADSAEYTVSFPKEFTVGYTDGNMKAVAKILDTDQDALKQFCNQNNICLLAVTSGAKEQVRLSVYETPLSSSAEDISAISKENLDILAHEITDGEYTFSTVSGCTCIKVTEKLTDVSGGYTCTQYLTVKNKKVYHFITYSDENGESPLVTASLNSFKFVSKNVFSTRQKITIISVISVLTCVIGFMIFSIVKDIKNSN